MKRNIAVVVGALTLAACAGQAPLNITPRGSPLAEGGSAAARVQEAQAHLALGNVAFAAEGFRRALREDPTSVAALTGLAGCYDRMGRFDLSRVQYERALALKPADADIFTSFAASLERGGSFDEAESLRKELASRTVGSSAELALATLIGHLDREGSSILTENGRAVQVALGRAAATETTSPVRSGRARLERVDVGEMVLITSKAPHWKPLPGTTKLASVTRSAGKSSASTVRLTILNAGSAEGMAARTRSRLQQFGWRSVAIANASLALERSELRYPAALERDVARLTRQLPMRVRAIRSENVDRIVLRLGRDALAVPGRA